MMILMFNKIYDVNIMDDDVFYVNDDFNCKKVFLYIFFSVVWNFELKILYIK